MDQMRKSLHLFAVSLMALILASCGDDKPQEALIDNSQEKLDYYAANPDFFTYASVDDLPTDLIWEDGSNLPDIGSPNAKKGGTWHERVQDYPRTLRTLGPDSNGFFRSYIGDYARLQFVHDHPDPGDDAFHVYPGVALEWAADRENKTVYCRIDPDARFTDGEPVTVDDVFFTFYFMHSKHITAPWYNDYYSTFFTNITRYDDHTFSVSVPEARPDMVYRALSFTPFPEHFFREFGEDFVERYQWRYVPSTGAYVVNEEDIEKGRSIALTRVKDWWAKDKKFWRNRYNPDKIHFTVIRDAAKAFEAFKRGELDRISLNLAEFWYDKLPNTDDIVQSGYIHKSVFYNQRPRPTYGLWINQSKPLLDNQDIRIGISYASNWDHVIETFFRGDYVRMRTYSDGYGPFSHPSLKARSFDFEKALEHFAKAGFVERGADGILVNAEGQRLSFTLTTGYESLKDVLTILKEEAQKAGLELRIEVLDQTSGWKKFQEKKHDIMFTAFATFYEMYPRYWEYFHSDNAYEAAFLEDGTPNPERELKTQTNNATETAIQELDALIEIYRHGEDADEMIALAHQMNEILYEDASFIPGFVQPFYRTGHWRWTRYPETFNTMHSSNDFQHFVHWIDEDLKAETLAARKSGETFPPQVNVYDQYKDQ